MGAPAPAQRAHQQQLRTTPTHLYATVAAAPLEFHAHTTLSLLALELMPTDTLSAQPPLLTATVPAVPGVALPVGSPQTHMHVLALAWHVSLLLAQAKAGRKLSAMLRTTTAMHPAAPATEQFALAFQFQFRHLLVLL